MYITGQECVVPCFIVYIIQTVRLSDGESYQLLRVLNTMEIYGWHTLTYLTFHPAKVHTHTHAHAHTHAHTHTHARTHTHTHTV